MASPIKSVDALQGHRTKREKALRREAEAALLTGEPMQERSDVRNAPEAHAEFLRLRKLLRIIGRDDNLYSQQINDYCTIHAETLKIPGEIGHVNDELENLEQRRDELDVKQYYQIQGELYSRKEKLTARLDRLRDKKRVIEDKNLMNIHSSLRAAQKPQKEHVSPLAAILADG